MNFMDSLLFDLKKQIGLLGSIGQRLIGWFVLKEQMLQQNFQGEETASINKHPR